MNYQQNLIQRTQKVSLIVEILISMKPKIMKIPNSLSLFHINSSSLNKNFEYLKFLLKATNKTLKDTTNLSKNINIYNYSVEFTPNETRAGEILLCINNKLS